MAYILGVSENNGIILDPRTKLLLLIIINVIVFNKLDSHLMSILLIFFVTSLFIFSKKYKTAIVSLAIYLSYTLVLMYILPHLTGFLAILIGSVLVMFYKLMPIILMGAYFILTTGVSEFVASMEKIHMPQEIIIPLSVVFRFFPTVVEEVKSIIDCMKISGIGLNFKNLITRPLKMLEYLLIPLIISIVKGGDELSAAVLTRSMDNPVQRTNICKIGFHWQDYLYILLGLLLLMGLFI